MDIFKVTATNLFIRPLFKIPMRILDEFDFQNAYIKDEIKGIDYPHSIYMLFKAGRQEEFGDFVERERKKGHLIDEYDYPDGYTMLVYKYHEKWKNDVDLIMAGRFSEVSSEYKDEIPSKTGDKNSTIMSIQHHVFLKTDFIRGMWREKYGLEFERGDECWHFYPEREIFNEETLKRLKE